MPHRCAEAYVSAFAGRDLIASRRRLEVCPISCVSRKPTPLRAIDRTPADVEVSVVMPCLNEAETLGICIEKAQQALARPPDRRRGHCRRQRQHRRLAGHRGAARRARRPCARARVWQRPHGRNPAARGRFIIMGDADDSYDFLEIPRFVEKLREGHDLVQGCRLPAGGGRIMPGAMPALHRYWGNPMFSAMARRWFRAPIHDVYCGLRGFRREFYHELDQRCTGMEFATEMIVKSSLRSARIAEVPITLHPDGRKTRAPHLRTFRDGWRTLRFFLLYSPRYLFLAPGGFLIALGLLGYALALPAVTIRGATLDAHTLLFSSLALICGYQSILFARLHQDLRDYRGAAAEGSSHPTARPDRDARAWRVRRGGVPR